MYSSSLDLEIMNDERLGGRLLFPRTDLTPSDTIVPFSFKRHQFPVRHSFCKTINEAQGKTGDCVGIYLL